ncbi:CBS domain-containing protein [Fulvivirga lutea]|uniref:CBS domain-containing protein n=1 Tax=Fulvivirga lutea TaxID=2810512 RepID=A0A974WKU1_9BACT|nr:CBS domain-containing protein [Fulvivirga lutea]QSE98015.1 CBS domain-containing protein [Fulvivirga lutea]
MGEHITKTVSSEHEHSTFLSHLLSDIKALEYMLNHQLIESGIARIGAEQEFCLVDDSFRPSDKAVEILHSINDSHFTTELAKYNLEINLDPEVLEANCFKVMEVKLLDLLALAGNHAQKFDNKILLTGILPTISKNTLEYHYLTPIPRYYALNERMKELRGDDFSLHLKGVDELTIKHSSVLFEACNTSFQMHLQVDPENFADSYNWSQAIAGPVLAACTNSPLLLGRELWSENRIALFQQSIDTRSSSYALKDQLARVSFGQKWVKDSIVNIYKEDISRFPIILTKEIQENSENLVKQGKIPKLEALNLHSGTIYKWNRACYGAAGGKAHVRIENRYIPAGPNVKDEMANFVFWAGLMLSQDGKYRNIAAKMDFKDAKSNFLKAARYGKESILIWDNKHWNAPDLILKVLLPLAKSGLKKLKINEQDISDYLTIIEKRVKGTSGSQWIINNYRKLNGTYKKDDSLVKLCECTFEHQQKNIPIHRWPDCKLKLKFSVSSTIEHIMSTQLITVRAKDSAQLALSIMNWNNIHHMPVDDGRGKLMGLLTYRHISKLNTPDIDSARVADIMVEEVISITPNTPIKEAIEIMKKNEFGCLPVIEHEELVGIVTIKDVTPFD